MGSEIKKTDEQGISNKQADQNNIIIKSQVHGELKKKIVKHGEGFLRPDLESCCLIDISVDRSHFSNNRDNAFDSPSVQTGENIEVTIGGSDSEFMRRIEMCLMTMKKGEVSEFTFDIHRKLPQSVSSRNDSHADEEDSKVLQASLSENHTTISLSLSSFSQTLPTWKMSPDEKYKLALSHKTQGTELFQGGNVEAAFHYYSTAVKYLICIPELSAVSEAGLPCLTDDCSTSLEELRKLQCVCYLNLGACQAKVANQQGVMENCSRALTLDPHNVKALYRRAVASIACGKQEEARKDLLRAQKLEPKNTAIASLLQSCF